MQWLVAQDFTPLAITSGYHQVSRFVCICMQSMIFQCSNKRDSITQVRGLIYLSLWKKTTTYLHGIKLWNNLQSSSFPLLYLWKILHKFKLKFFTWFHKSTWVVWLRYVTKRAHQWSILSTFGRRILLNIVVDDVFASFDKTFNFAIFAK